MTELERLQYRVESLEAALGQDLWPEESLGLTAIPRKIGGLLAKRGYASFDALHLLLYADEPRTNNAISTAMKRLRAALKPRGITIKSDYGAGFYVWDSDLLKLRQIFSAEKPNEPDDRASIPDQRQRDVRQQQARRARALSDARI